MLKRSFVNTSSLVFAAATEATGPDASKARQKANTGKASEGDGDPNAKVVYIKAEDSAKSVMAHLESMANSTLLFVASLVVHMVVRHYHHDDTQRHKDFKTTITEIESMIQDYARFRKGKPFQHAWTSRLIQMARKQSTALLTDYARKGVTGPILDVLRSKTADKACDVVYDCMMQKTKGETSLAALENAFEPETAKKTRTPQETGKPGNAVKASTDKPERIAAALASDKGHLSINAIKGNAKKKAERLADTVNNSNIDHETFIIRSLASIIDTEVLMRISQAALDRAKELQAEANKGKEPARPAKAAAEAAAG